MPPAPEPAPPLVALRDVVREINKSSNNLASRHLMLSLAPGFPARAATMAAAQERVRGWLQRQGFAADDLVIDNGLAPYDIVPLLPILAAAGAVVTGLDGELPLDGGFALAAATPELHARAMAILRPAFTTG